MRSFKLDSVSDDYEFTLISSDGEKFTTNDRDCFYYRSFGDLRIRSYLCKFGLWNDGRLHLTIRIDNHIRGLILIEVKRIIETSEFNNFSEIYTESLERCVAFIRSHISDLNNLIDKL